MKKEIIQKSIFDQISEIVDFGSGNFIREILNGGYDLQEIPYNKRPPNYGRRFNFYTTSGLSRLSPDTVDIIIESAHSGLISIGISNELAHESRQDLRLAWTDYKKLLEFTYFGKEVSFNLFLNTQTKELDYTLNDQEFIKLYRKINIPVSEAGKIKFDKLSVDGLSVSQDSIEFNFAAANIKPRKITLPLKVTPV